MLFPTLDYAIFFIAVFSLAWASQGSNSFRKILLIGASYFFYGYWDWRFLLLLAGSSTVCYVAGRLLSTVEPERDRKWILAIAVTLNLVVLGFFKYYGFFLDSLGEILAMLEIQRDLPFLEIILPVGISFFTFQAISYLVDIYRGQIEAEPSYIDVLLYISFFPQLVAGPIVRAAHFLPQLHQPPKADRVLMSMGLLLIVTGMFKKVVLANYLATEMVDQVFFDPASFGSLDALLAMYGYAIQIYCDFSAYSDIAIGSAALLGYRFQRNFDQPYRATSLQDFWRRWHISLSSWLRDYLYIPLGGSRGGPLKTARNLFLTMLLGGLWHGAAWTFVLWGVAHGLWLGLERLFQKAVPLGSGFVTACLGWLVTWHFVVSAWVLFRSESLDHALAFLDALGNSGAEIRFFTPFMLILLIIGMGMQFTSPRTFAVVEKDFSRLPAVLQGILFALGLTVIDAFGPEGIAPFIYFQF